MQPLEALAREAPRWPSGMPHRSHAEAEVGAHDADLQRLPLLRGLLRGVPGDDAAAGVRRRPTSTTWPTCATTAAPACTPASTRRRTSSPSTCRRRWRACAAQTYADYAWPPALGALYQRNGLTLALALAAGLALFLVLAVARQGHAVAARSPAATSTRVSAQPDGGLVRAGVRVRRAGARRGRARASGATCAPATAGVARRGGEAAHDVLRAEVPRRRPRRGLQQRRRCLHAVRAGASTTSRSTASLLCFAATSVATLYHYVLGLAGALRAGPACPSCWAWSAVWAW